MQQRSEETRSQLLEAAYRVFARVGYDGAGVAEICDTAGVSKGAFYHHFPSKQAVFLALLEQWLAGLDVAFARTRTEAQNTPQALLSMAETAGNVLQAADAQGSLAILLAFWMQARRDPAVWQAAVAPYRRYQEYLAEMVRQGQVEGSLRDMDAKAAARSILALAIGVLMQALFDPHSTDWDNEVKASFSVLIQGMQKGSI